MTVTTSINKVQALGNGVTTSFPYSFRIYSASELVVTRTVIATGVNTTLVLNTDYTVTGAASYNGGNVVCSVAPATGTRLTIRRALTVTQETDLRNQGAYFAETHEDVFDRHTMVDQQQQEQINRAIHFPEADAALTSELPAAADRASKAIVFDEDGNVTVSEDDYNDQLANVTAQAGIATAAAASATSSASSAASSATSATASQVAAALSAIEASGYAGYFTQAGTGAVTTTAQLKMRQIVSVMDFGAVGNGVADDTAAIQLALNTGKRVYLPHGTYLISSPLNITLSGTSLIGANKCGSILKSNSTTVSMITTTGNLTGIELRDFSLTRSVVPVSGASGISTITSVLEDCAFSNILIDTQWDALALGPAPWGMIDKIKCADNYGHGVYMTHTSTVGTLQWVLTDILCQRNNGNGFYVRAFSGTSVVSVSMGTWNGCTTYANAGYGMLFQGDAANSINGVRLEGGFVGNDNTACISFDTHGYQHMIHNLFVEEAGIGATGVGSSTPQVGTASGVLITVSNGPIIFSGCRITNCSRNGILSACTGMITVTACSITNNGMSSPADTRSSAGIYVTGGLGCVFNGGFAGSYGGSTTQKYGIYTYNGVYQSIVGSDLTGNATAAWDADTNVMYIQSIGNMPSTLNVNLSAQGAVILNGGVTGGFGAAATLNVGGGLLKNGVAYTNP